MKLHQSFARVAQAGIGSGKWVGVMVACAALRVAAADYDVKAYGAVGDGRHVDTPGIDQAITAAHAAGGGVVRFPAGTYLSVTIHLQSNVTLQLDPGATIEAAHQSVATFDAPEPNEWGDKKYQDFGHSHWRNSLFYGENLVNIGITGPGLIHGQGLDKSDAPPAGAGNKTIALKNCRNVILRDFSILHGGHFGVLATGVDNLSIDNLKIDTNRDGIDIDCCRHVRVSNCQVNSPYDDAICLKSSFGLGENRATEDVAITNCEVSGFVEGSMLDGTYNRANLAGSPLTARDGPCGRIKFGTESNGGYKNVVISNCVFEHCRGLALEAVDGAWLEDVSITNLTMRDIQNSAIFIRLGDRARGPNHPAVGFIRRVNLSNIVASDVDGRLASIISGIPGHPVEDLTLSNIRILYRGGGTADDAARQPPEKETTYPDPVMFGTMPAYGFFLRHASGVSMRDIYVGYAKPELRPVMVMDDVHGATLERVHAVRDHGNPAMVLHNVSQLTVADSLGLADLRRDQPVAEEKL